MCRTRQQELSLPGQVTASDVIMEEMCKAGDALARSAPGNDNQKPRHMLHKAGQYIRKSLGRMQLLGMAKAGTLCPHQSLKHGVSMGVLMRYQSSTAREWDVCATCDHCCQLKVSRSSCGGTAAIIKALLCSAHCITTAFFEFGGPHPCSTRPVGAHKEPLASLLSEWDEPARAADVQRMQQNLEGGPVFSEGAQRTILLACRRPSHPIHTRIRRE